MTQPSPSASSPSASPVGPRLPTNAREALAGRSQVLGTLTTAGAIRGGGAELTGSLRAGWQAERRLIDRVLADTPADQSVFTTLDRWEERTRAFQQKAGLPEAGWTDKQGDPWRADQVLALILDLRDRLSAWQEKAVPATPGAPAGPGAIPGPGAPPALGSIPTPNAQPGPGAPASGTEAATPAAPDAPPDGRRP